MSLIVEETPPREGPRKGEGVRDDDSSGSYSRSRSTSGVRRVRRPTRDEFFGSFVANSEPFVWEGGMSEWRAMTRWRDTDYLIDKIGPETIVPLRRVEKATKQSPGMEEASSTRAIEWLGLSLNSSLISLTIEC